MINKDYFKNKKVTIVGLARSGFACANLLSDLGAQVSVTDSQDNDSTRSNAIKLKDIKVELGRHSQGLIRNRDLLVVSPGVSDDALPISWAKEFNIPIISEIEVAWILCPATVIAVTGTNGKTTVATLIGRILEAAGERVFVCGNIGNPFCGELPKIEKDAFVSLEVSSFQLERIQNFKPKISIILNFTSDHLDRYSDVLEYLKAKKRIFMNQDKSDYLVLNQEDRMLKDLAKETQANVVYFYGTGKYKTLSHTTAKIAESHLPEAISCQTPNLNPNFAASLAVGSILGIDKELCLGVFNKFDGLEHRLEYVAELNNIKFINDSKCTNIDSAIWAFKNILRPIVLIAGGRDKGSDYSLILDLMQSKVKEVILIGEAKKKIENAWAEFLSIHEASSLEEAVKTAFSLAKAGDCVLLSPMCSSFDMFSNYEERGRIFKKAVYDLIRNKS